MKKYLFTFVCTIMVLISSAHAQPTGGVGPTGPTGGAGPTTVSTQLQNPFKGAGNTLQSLFTAIIQQIILPIGAVVAVISFIWSGFLFVTAQGDEAKIKTARTALLYTAIGTAVLLGAAAITAILQNTIDALKTP